jgi:hypothetical protein
MLMTLSIGEAAAGLLNDAPMGQRQICKGGSIGQGVILRMNTARAWVQGAEAGQPPARHNRIAQSTG